MFCSLLTSEFLSNANAVVVLITGLFGLISAGVGAFFAVRNFIKLAKEKSLKEIWAMIKNMADTAMKEAEKDIASGIDRKTAVMNAVKEGCKAEGLDIGAFIDQLSAYIDELIKFHNDMNTAEEERKANNA